jgi:SAM-dependent methyltransferase
MHRYSLARRVLAKIWTPRFHQLRDFVALFHDKRGLEIGGPSEIFTERGPAPVYETAAAIDNCTFSTKTVWEPDFKGEFSYGPKRLGRQFTAEAAALDFAPDMAYDFVLSSHMLEHSANPLRVLHEWRRVLKREGALLLALPEGSRTFDHQRPATSLDHLVEDFEQNRDEADLTHLPEVLQLHDFSLAPEAGTFEEFKLRGLDNFRNRCLHHHVFDSANTRGLLELAGFQVRAMDTVYPHHIIAIALKTHD